MREKNKDYELAIVTHPVLPSVRYIGFYEQLGKWSIGDLG